MSRSALLTCVLTCFALSVLLVSGGCPEPEPEEEAPCIGAQIYCGHPIDGHMRCLDPDARCDGIVSCIDFSDELGCGECEDWQDECPNHAYCVHEDEFCDEDPDCPDGGDEGDHCCYPNEYYECRDGDLWQFDSCGNPEEVQDYCEPDEVCVPIEGDDRHRGECTDDCQPGADIECGFGGQVWWVDSCGEQQEPYDARFEPNQGLDEAWPIDESGTWDDLTLCPESGEWYEFELQEGERLEVLLEEPSVGEISGVVLYHPDGARVPWTYGAPELDVGEAFADIAGAFGQKWARITAEEDRTVYLSLHINDYTVPDDDVVPVYEMDVDLGYCGATTSESQCYGGDSYWLDGCGNRYALRARCADGEDCHDGVCEDDATPGDDDDSTTEGCDDGSVEQVYSATMVGCNDPGFAVTQANAGDLCAPGWHLCSRSEYETRGGPGSPSTGCINSYCPRWLATTGDWDTYDCACDDVSGDRMIVFTPNGGSNLGLHTENASAASCQDWWSFQFANWTGPCSCSGENPGCAYLGDISSTATLAGAVCCD